MRTCLWTAVVASMLAAGFASVGHGSSERARVRLLDPAPVTLRGVGFAAGERVKLTVVLGERTTRRGVRATQSGSFTVTFPAYRYNRCNGSLEIRAAGSKGTRVSWELIPLECPDALDS